MNRRNTKALRAVNGGGLNTFLIIARGGRRRMNFYKQPTWISKRIKILKRDEYLCQECKRYGRSTAATTVHHIIPLSWCLIFNKLLALASINLVSLCTQCHNKMHDRDSDALTSSGLEWVRRMGKIGLEWIDKYNNNY